MRSNPKDQGEERIRQLEEELLNARSRIAELEQTRRQSSSEAQLPEQMADAALIESLPTAVFYKDLKGNYLGCNKACEDLLGISREVLRETNAAGLFPPAYARVHSTKDRQLLQTGSNQEYESLVIGTEGTIRSVLFRSSLVFDKNGNPYGITGEITHKTTLERFDDATQTQDDLLSRSLLDAIPIPVVILDADGLILSCNPAFEKIAGRTKKKLIGRTFPDFLPEPLANALSAQAENVRLSGKPSTQSTWQHDPDYNSLILETSFSPFYGPNGVLLGLIGSCKDITQQKQQEEALRQSEKLLSATISSIDGLLNVLTPDLHLLYSNWKDHDFVPEQERYGKPFCYKAFKHRNTPCNECPARMTFQDGKVRTVETHNSLTGAHKEVTITPIFDALGEVSHVVEFVRDITERKRTTQALEKSEQLYRMLFHFANDAIYLFSFLDSGKAGQFLQVNDVACKMLGYSREELQQLSIYEIDSRGLDSLSPEMVAHFLRTHHLLHEAVHVARDGSLIPVEINTRLFVLDDQTCSLSIVRNIQDRKQAEQLLRETEERYRLLLEATSDGIWDINLETGKEYLSPTLGTLFGLPPRTLLTSLQLRQHVHPDDLNCFPFQENKFTAEEADSFECEYRIRRPDDAYRWILTRSKVVRRSSEGKASRVIGSNMDITQRKEMEEALRQSEEHARAILAAIPDTMLIVTREGFIKEWYAGEGSRFCMDDVPPTGRSLADVLPANIAKSILASVSDTLDSGAMQIFEYRLPMHLNGMKEFEARIVKRSAKSALIMVRDVTLLRNTEAALYEANQRLRLAMRFANEGKWECDFAANTYQYDEQAARMLGYAPDEAEWPAEQWQKRIHPDDRERVLAAMNASLSGKIPYYSEEYRIQRKNGTFIWISGVGGVVRREENGAPRLFMGINRDITGRKEAEQKLSVSEEKYRMLAHNIRDAIYTLGEDMKPTFISPLAEPLTGYTLKELYSMSPEECLTPDSRERFVELIQRQMKQEVRGLAEQVPTYQEYTCLRKDGSTIVVEGSISVLRGDDGRFRGFIGIVRDISERTKARKALEESEKRFRLIFNTTPVALLEEDYSQVKINLDVLREGGITDFKTYFAEHPEQVRRLADKVQVININPFTHEMFEDERAHYMPRAMTDMFNELSFKSFGETLALIAQGSNSISHMRVHQTMKGKRLDTKFTWTIFPGYESTWEKVLVSAVDVTELMEARRQADLANKAKSQFLSSMSHDIRTPISGIMGMLQLLEQGQLNTKQKNYAKTARQSCALLNRLLADILDLSKLEAGKLVLSHKPFLLQDVLDSLTDLFSFSAEQAGLSFSIHTDKDIPLLMGDEHNLLRILTNLVGNSLKFTSTGSVSVSATPTRINPEEETVRILLTVSDTGMGIPEDKIEKMFQPYAQGDYLAPQQGVGLGLSIVKQFVTMMRGSISVVSEEKKGSTFYVDIPFAMAPDSDKKIEKQQQKTGTDQALPGFTALVVEDDRISLTTVTRFLEKMGGQVSGFLNGEDALKFLLHQPVDIIMLDIQLPGMNGLQVTDCIRNAPEFKERSKTPIVILTAYAMSEDKNKFLAAGADAYLAKPLEKEHLESALARIFGKAAPKLTGF